MAELGHTSEEPFQSLTRLSLNDLPKLESIYWTPLPFPVLEEIVISSCPKLRRLPLNSASAKGNQVRLDLDEECIRGVEWEDEATKQRFSELDNRDFPQMAEEGKPPAVTIIESKRANLVINEDHFPEWCLNLRKPINAHLLSISTDDLFSSSWVDMDCPHVEVLVLNLSSSDYALPNFIVGMNKLKVLTITNHKHYPARLSNLSCLSSLPNVKRIIMNNVSITLLDILQLQLGSLNKLSLVMCSFGEVTHDTKEIEVSKALPSLQEIKIDNCHDLHELPYWISEVVSLKSLSITNCHRFSELPEAIGNLSELEVLRLSFCINLSELPETTERLDNLRFLDISDCLELRKLPLEIGKLQKLKKILMGNCWKCELPDSVMNLENLEVQCDEKTGFLWERLKPKMRNLIVREEEEIKHSLNFLQMF